VNAKQGVARDGALDSYEKSFTSFFSRYHRSRAGISAKREKAPDTFFPSGFFIVTPIYMIAEKASEVILADAKQVCT